MKKILSIVVFASLITVSSCKKDSEFLDVPPTNIIPEELAFSDPALVLSVLGDLYNRQLDFSSLDGTPRNVSTNGDREPGWRTFTDFGEAFASENGSDFINQRSGWGYGEWGRWDYAYIRDLNLFIQRATASTQLTDADKSRFLAEARFLRANFYFETVKRMGGVPLVTEPLEYDYSGNVTVLQKPRAKESEIYDFIISEAEAIKNLLPADANIKSRVTKGAALAMQSRAALYAGSIARYGATTPQVALAGGEVGIPASMATGYYTKALAAAQEIINGSAGAYQLYKVLPDLSDNFAALFLDKSTVNQESIWIEDFKVGGVTHAFTTNNQPFSVSDEGADAGRINPSLNLVESFERLDNTYAPLATTDAAGNPVYYTDQQDIFEGRDARLAGTVLIPNALFKGKRIDIWAGYLLANGSILTGSDATDKKTLPGTTTPVQVVGQDGPVNGLELRTQTGFYIRKYLDPAVGSGRRGRGSEVAFIRYRFGEVLLNAAEAAFELGNFPLASDYINQVRERAGLTTAIVLNAANGFERIVHERRVELAFEGHLLYDLKRWRLAHIVWDGNQMNVTDLVSNIGSARKRNTQAWGLWPYRYHNPGNPNDGKWIFREVKPSKVTGSARFLLGNYYSFIDNNIRSANPQIVQQPNQ
jgi:starch-binding outer membrane protein, SusD/RagB family